MRYICKYGVMINQHLICSSMLSFSNKYIIICICNHDYDDIDYVHGRIGQRCKYTCYMYTRNGASVIAYKLSKFPAIDDVNVGKYNECGDPVTVIIVL